MSTINPSAERRSSRRSRSSRGGGRIPQLQWRGVENPYQPTEFASEEQIEAIHATSMRILSELGIRVLSPQVMDLFESVGAIVDRGDGTVRVGEDIIAEMLQSVPREFTLTSRNPARRLTLGGRHMVFGLVAGPPNVHDCINGRRTGNLNDYQNFIRLAHYFNAIHIIGNQVTAPQELPANNRHLDTYLANVTLSDRSFHCSAIGHGRAMDGINMMAIARGVSLDEMAREPGVITIISVNSPRLLDGEMAEGLMTMAKHGQPVVITPFTLMGAMTPVSLPAALAQQNAEALFGVVLAQLVRRGSPVMYGAFTSNVDMKSGAPAFGTPENTKANIISGQLARRYGLPYRTSNANASNAVDLQAAYETAMATWGAVAGGANLIYHAAGWLEGGLTASYEKLILDVEILQNIMEILRPIDFSDAELGFDAIASVPTGGHFFGAEHTLQRYETAFYSPMLSDWTNHGAWEAAGSKDALARATVLWQRALQEYEEPIMEESVREELAAYVLRRKVEIAGGEP